MKPSILLLICLLLLSGTNFAQKIPLTPSMLSYYQGMGNNYIDLSPLADEQALITTTSLTNNASAPYATSKWNPSWGATPAVQVDLGKNYAITQIALFDSWNQTNLIVKYNKDGAWENLFSWDMSYNEKWKSVQVNIQTDKLLFEFSGLSAQVGEIAVFGSGTSTGGGENPADQQAPTTPTALAHSNLTQTGLSLKWNASTDNVGVTEYEIFRNGSLFTSVAGTSATITDLISSSAYQFKVRAKDAANNLSGFSNEISVTTPASEGSGPCSPSKLTLTPSMIINESGKGDAKKLVDEQTLAGQPASGQGGAPSTTWFPGWSTSDYPASVYIDFGKTTTISAIYLRDINDVGTFVVEAGSPGNWNTLLTDNLTGYQSWNQHNVNISTRYLRFTRKAVGANVAEVVIYGCSGPAVLDVTAPAPIATLSAQTITSSSIQLAWTATGDDGNSGTASVYDIRYSTSPISSESAFTNATRVTGAPVPLASGTAQTFVVTGLAPATSYYFAMKVRDEAGNASALSNMLSATTSSATTPSITRITIDQFMGINAFVDDPLDKIKVAGFVREYHDWNWDEGNIWNGSGNLNYQGYPNNHMKWAPSEPGWSFDDFYTSIRDAGVGISPVIQGSVYWLHGGTTFPYHNKPVDEPGASTTNPNSYEKKAHHMYQFAARYGSTPVADSKLTLAPGQPRKSGMGLIRYIEDWNEQDKFWEGPAAQFTPEEYAAMASANYDGHARTMKQGSGTFGVKNADPNMKLVMGGIYELNLNYIKRMKTWFEQNRPDKKFAADVINVHTYAWLDGEGPGGGGPAKSPEEDNFKEKLKVFVDYRNQNLPGVEVWISEFGWDTHPNSTLRVPVIGPFDRQEVQGQWLVRAYLAFAAAGVDRAQMFMLRDVNPNDATHFSTSGLVGPKGNWTPKKSWYYVYTMKNTLQNMVFIGEQASGNPNILIYKFKNISGSNGTYVVWSKTKSNNTVNGYSLTLAGSPTLATKIEMAPNDINGVNASLQISTGKVSVNVSERPIFIKVDKIE